jgi:hypothetical protein
MSRLKDMIESTPIHKRRIEIRTYPLEDENLLAEGWLEDERFVQGYRWDGQPRAAGAVHRMCIRILVGGRPLSILDAEAEMLDVPHDLCPTTLDSAKRIIGLPIASGYSESVHRRIGGVQGCTHLTHLITTMGPAVLHGYWTQRSRKRRPFPRSLAELPGAGAIINSCRLWREDGPLVQKARETLRLLGEKPGGEASQDQ